MDWSANWVGVESIQRPSPPIHPDTFAEMGIEYPVTGFRGKTGDTIGVFIDRRRIGRLLMVSPGFLCSAVVAPQIDVEARA